MSGQHTPGPWTAQFGIDQMCNPGTTIVSMPPVSGKEQSSVFDVKARERGGRWFIFSDADTHGSSEADARLIAAAPELLGALRGAITGLEVLEEALDVLPAGLLPGLPALIRDARAAIAKASPTTTDAGVAG